MNMPFPSRKQVESIRKNYPPGTRVMLTVLTSWTIPITTISPMFLSLP